MPSQSPRVVALGLLIVRVEVDQDRDRRLADLESKEGAGVLALFELVIHEGPDEEELVIVPNRPTHVVSDISLELAPRRHRVVSGEGGHIGERVAIAVQEDEVAEEETGRYNIPNDPVRDELLIFILI